MTETTARIRWTKEDDGGTAGRTGTQGEPLFWIYPPESPGKAYILTAMLPGHTRDFYPSGYVSDLKAKAEEWLGEFVASLGAVWPDEREEFEEFEFPRDGIDLEAAFDLGAYVRYQHPDAGWEDDQEAGRKLLTHGRLYRVAWNDIGQSKTRIGLVGVEGVGFNSVLFEPVAVGDVTNAEAAEVARRDGIGQAASKKEEG